MVTVAEVILSDKVSEVVVCEEKCMTQGMTSECVVLKNALAEFAGITQKTTSLLKEQEDKKQAAINALGRVIIRYVEKHGTIKRSADKTWYRMMPCVRMAKQAGLQELMNAAFGEIDWELLFRPALEHLKSTKACFIFCMGNCLVVLCEKLTSSEVKAIRRSRRAR